MQRFSLGLDIGSISVNTVIISPERKVVENHYTLCHGRPFHALNEVLSDILKRHPAEAFDTVAITGTGGKLAAEMKLALWTDAFVIPSSWVVAVAIFGLVPTAFFPLSDSI